MWVVPVLLGSRGGSWIGDLSASPASLTQPCALEGRTRSEDLKLGLTLESCEETIINADSQAAQTC